MTKKNITNVEKEHNEWTRHLKSFNRLLNIQRQFFYGFTNRWSANTKQISLHVLQNLVNMNGIFVVKNVVDSKQSKNCFNGILTSQICLHSKNIAIFFGSQTSPNTPINGCRRSETSLSFVVALVFKKKQ